MSSPWFESSTDVLWCGCEQGLLVGLCSLEHDHLGHLLLPYRMIYQNPMSSLCYTIQQQITIINVRNNTSDTSLCMILCI